jgi:hypothetical protein
VSPAFTRKPIEQLSIEEVVDEFSELDRQYQSLKPNLDRLKAPAQTAPARDPARQAA